MPTTTTAPNIRVVVRLPWNRSDNPLPDPPLVEWNAEKADILWKVIERSRSSDSGGTDWKALASRLEVPLPYLLYRVNARFEEDLRGLKDIQGALSPSGSQPPLRPFDIPPVNKPFPTDRSASRLTNSPHLTGPGRPLTPLGVRARLSSLNSNSSRQPRKATSSSTLTSQGQKKSFAPLSPTASSPEDTDSEDEALRKEEDADRAAEEQELLDRKLQQLQMMMTNEALGLVSSLRPREKGKALEHGKAEPEVRRSMAGSERHDTLSNRSNSQSVSSASSLQGSIPDIPSPPEMQSRPPLSRRMSFGKSTSPPTVSQGTALGQRYRPLADRSRSESSSHGSEASSFSDLSDASLSASALESALLSNIRGNGSRLTQFARSRMISRT